MAIVTSLLWLAGALVFLLVIAGLALSPSRPASAAVAGE